MGASVDEEKLLKLQESQVYFNQVSRLIYRYQSASYTWVNHKIPMSYFNYINELLQDYQTQIIKEFRELRSSATIDGLDELKDAKQRGRKQQEECIIF